MKQEEYEQLQNLNKGIENAENSLDTMRSTRAKLLQNCDHKVGEHSAVYAQNEYVAICNICGDVWGSDPDEY